MKVLRIAVDDLSVTGMYVDSNNWEIVTQASMGGWEYFGIANVNGSGAPYDLRTNFSEERILSILASETVPVCTLNASDVFKDIDAAKERFSYSESEGFSTSARVGPANLNFRIHNGKGLFSVDEVNMEYLRDIGWEGSDKSFLFEFFAFLFTLVLANQAVNGGES